MNKQRKVLITITYNELGIIVDTKTEELGSPAQPEHTETHSCDYQRTETHARDLISRQAAIDALGDMVMNWTDSDYELGQLNQWKADRKAIIDLPSAQPEIVRCKDCRFYEWMSNRVPEEQTWYCHNWNAETGKDDYCSYAERRE